MPGPVCLLGRDSVCSTFLHISPSFRVAIGFTNIKPVHIKTTIRTDTVLRLYLKGCVCVLFQIHDEGR